MNNSDPTPTGAGPSNPDVSALLADALKQQASQFEAIMQAQLDKLNIGQSSPRLDSETSKKTTKKTAKPTATSSACATPPTRKAPRASTSAPRASASASASASTTPKTPKNSKGPKSTKTPTPTPTRRSNPLQMLLVDTPADFKTMKDALFIHIKMMWGLFMPDDVPATPDPELLREFYARFSNVEQVEAVVSDPAAAALVAQDQILTLRNSRAGKSARGMAHIDQIFILYIHGVLCKVGIRIWCPDLLDSPDSLYNSACRIVCLNTFRQLLAGGAYTYMNVNLKYTDAMPLLFMAYNHYVHYRMTTKYKVELKNVGKVAENNKRKNAQKRRERICLNRMEYVLRNRASLPPRYRAIVEDLNAHSDDEKILGKDAYEIKTLPYRSNNANKFFRRLDVEMLNELVVTGKDIKRVIRKLPRTPAPSKFRKPPSKLPIDFYDPDWFNALPSAQKRVIPDKKNVAFLPNASHSLKPTPHPDERLGDKRFSGKYLDMYLEEYEFSDDEDDEDDEDGVGVAIGDDSIIVDGDGDDDEDGGNVEEDGDEDDGYFTEGDFGELYDKMKGKECEEDEDEDEEEDVMDE